MASHAPRYRGLRLDGPVEEFHQAIDRLRWDTVPALNHQPPAPPTQPRHRRAPGDGQARLDEGGIVNINLHLTDTTDLRAEGYIAGDQLFAEIRWGFPDPTTRLGNGALWGTPAMMRRLAELAVQAAIQAEEEACWHAHQAATAIPQQGRVA